MYNVLRLKNSCRGAEAEHKTAEQQPRSPPANLLTQRGSGAGSAADHAVTHVVDGVCNLRHLAARCAAQQQQMVQGGGAGKEVAAGMCVLLFVGAHSATECSLPDRRAQQQGCGFEGSPTAGAAVSILCAVVCAVVCAVQLAVLSASGGIPRRPSARALRRPFQAGAAKLHAPLAPSQLNCDALHIHPNPTTASSCIVACILVHCRVLGLLHCLLGRPACGWCAVRRTNSHCLQASPKHSQTARCARARCLGPATPPPRAHIAH
jgi:hypothetical protein